jgi:hypothetical protein
LTIYVIILECCFGWFTKSSPKKANIETALINQLPLFKWMNCSEQYDEFEFCMMVLFPSIDEQDVLMLKKFEGENSVLEGKFLNEPDVQVSVVINDEPIKSSITVCDNTP